MELNHLNKSEYNILDSRGFFGPNKKHKLIQSSFGISIVEIGGSVFAMDSKLYEKFKRRIK